MSDIPGTLDDHEPTSPCPLPPFDEELVKDITSSIGTDTVTEGCVEGAGIYDVFMRAHRDAIDQEWKLNRIKGPEYSQVYLGGMQTAMQSAVQFAVTKDKAAAEAELAKYAILKSKIDYLTAQANYCLILSQIEESHNKAKLLEIQGWTELAKINKDPVGVASVDTVEALREKGQHPDYPSDIQGVYGSQLAKAEAERQLLVQKKETERAQTHDGPANSDATNTYAGLVRKNKNVLQRQADGFIRDAETKAAKIAADMVNIEFSTMDGDVLGSNIGGQGGSGWGALVSTALGNTDDAKHATDDISNKG